jgi:hypothetical protein
VQIPMPARMAASVSIALAICSAVSAADPASLEFQAIKSDFGRFKAEFPGAPTEKVTDLGDGVKERAWRFAMFENSALRIFEISYIELPISTVRKWTPFGLLKTYRGALLAKNAKIVADRKIHLGQERTPGLEYQIEVPTDDHITYARQQLFLSGNRLYQLTVVVNDSRRFPTSKDADRFFDSFAIDE